MTRPRSTVVDRICDTVPRPTDARRRILAFDDDPVWLKGDATRLEQVLSNLLNNAAKYTEKGGHITLTTAAENGMAVIGISDDGVGIHV